MESQFFYLFTYLSAFYLFYFTSQSVGLRVFALLLLVISTLQGRQIDGREKAVGAVRGIKTFTWNDIEDYYPEIHREHDNEKYEEDSLNEAREERDTCSIIDDWMNKLNATADLKKCVCSQFKCICKGDNLKELKNCKRCGEID